MRATALLNAINGLPIMESIVTYQQDNIAKLLRRLLNNVKLMNLRLESLNQALFKSSI